MVKKWLLTILATFTVLALVACSSEGDKNEKEKQMDKTEEGAATASDIPDKLDAPVEIEFWHAMTGDLEKTLQEMTTRFNDAQENITVKLVNQGAYDDLSKKLMAAAKAKSSPVMAQAYEDWMTQYVDNELITDLTPYIEHEKHGWTDEELEDIVQVFREANTWNGKLYGVPFNKSTEILYYNTDLFEQKGVEVPTNWEAYQAAAKALTFEQAGKKVVGLGFENSIGLSFPTYVRQAGGTSIYADELKVTFDTPEAKEALTFLNDMIQEGSARLAGEDGYMSGPFGRGDVAMYVGSSAGLSFVAAEAEGKINWDVAVLPKGKEAATSFQGTNITIFESASPEQKLAAWEFMKFLTSPEETVFWATATGYVPVRTSALELSEWQSYVEENPKYAVAAQQLDTGFYSPQLKGRSGINEALQKEIQAVLLGQKSVEEGLKALQSSAQAAVDKANK